MVACWHYSALSAGSRTWDDRSVFYWVTKYTLGMTLKIIFRPRAWGARNVPRHGPVILASNHLSFSDHFFGPLPIPRKVIFLAKSEYFTGRGLKGLISRAFFAGVGQIPVDPAGGAAGGRAGDRHLPRGHQEPGRPPVPGQDRRRPAGDRVRRAGRAVRHDRHVPVSAAHPDLAEPAVPPGRPVRRAARFLPLPRPAGRRPAAADRNRRVHAG